MNIAFERDGVHVMCRVAGVCLHQGHVLLQQLGADPFWALPGGRAQLLETSRQALLREMQEEMHLTVSVGNLLWVVENFFVYGDRRFHELSFMYQFFLPEGCSYLETNGEFVGWEGAVPITFRWFPVDRLQDVVLYPSFLRSALLDLPERMTHVIHEDG